MADYVGDCPNITGSIDTGVRKNDAIGETSSGALFHNGYGVDAHAYSSGINIKLYQIISINAARTSTIYKQGVGVQPKSFQFLMIIKS